jgi:hypothetical protein
MSKKLLVALATTLVAGLLLVGAVYAQGGPTPTPPNVFTGRINFSGVVQSLPAPGGAGYGYGYGTPTPCLADDDRPDRNSSECHLVGVWQIQGLKVDVAADTHVHGNPQVGSLVKVIGVITPDGVVHAKNINEIKNGKHAGDNDDKVEFTGNVESLPSGTLIGIWTVSGRQVDISNDTEIKGSPQVGSLVKVEGVAVDDVVQADEVKVLGAHNQSAAAPANDRNNKDDDDDRGNGRGHSNGQASQGSQAPQNHGNQRQGSDSRGRRGD